MSRPGQAWEQVPLSELGVWFGGGTPSKVRDDFWLDGEVPWLSPKDMGAEVVRGTQDLITRAAVAESSVRLLPAGSVAVVVRSGILERKLPVALVPFATTLNQDMKALVPRDDVDARWVAWGLRAAERELLSRCRKAGTTVASIDTKRFMAHRLPLPPLAEQRRIVELLEEYLSRLNAAAAGMSASRRRLSQAEQAVIDAAVRPAAASGSTNWAAARLSAWEADGRPGTPPPAAEPDLEGWVKCKDLVSLESVTDPCRAIRYGILMPKVAAGDAVVPYIEVKDLLGNSLEGKVLHRTSLELDEKFAGARVRPGDVVLAVRGSYERSAIVPAGAGRTNLSRDVARLAPLGELRPHYLQAWLQSSPVKRHLARRARGVAVKGINIATIRALPVRVPAEEEQELAVAELDAHLAALRRLDQELQGALKRSDLLRREILTAAMSGRLHLQEAAHA